jgi:hypothetical protein
MTALEMHQAELGANWTTLAEEGIFKNGEINSGNSVLVLVLVLSAFIRVYLRLIRVFDFHRRSSAATCRG